MDAYGPSWHCNLWNTVYFRTAHGEGGRVCAVCTNLGSQMKDKLCTKKGVGTAVIVSD